MMSEHREGRPVVAQRHGQDLDLPTLLVFLFAGAFPVAFAFVTGPVVGLLALGVALATGLAAYSLTRDAFVVLVAAVVAPLMVTGVEVGLLSLLAAAALALAVVTRFPLAIVLVAVGLGLPGGAGVPLVALGVAATVAGTTYSRQLPFGVGLVVAVAVGIIAGVFHQAWVVMALGLVAGLLARYTLRHPAFPRLGGMMDRLAPWTAAAPAVLLFGLAAIGKEADVAPLRMLIVAWGAVGLGSLVAVAVYGLRWLMGASDVVVPVWLAFYPAAVLVVPATALIADLDTASRGASVVWVLFALPVALGARRLLAAVEPRRVLLTVAVAVAIVVASGLRLWLD